MNYYRRYIGDYMRDTGSLSLAEHGAYTLLLDQAYAMERPIPADRDEVMRLVRAFTTEERKAVDKVLSRFWVLEADGYHNARVDEELGKATKLIEKQKANGALGGRPKKTQTETQQETQTETQGLSQTETQNNQPPTTNHQPPRTNHQPPPFPKGKGSRAKPAKHPLPADFSISERVKAWAAEKGFDRLEDHLEAFRRKAMANAYAYADWDSAFMEAVREDWAKLRGRGAPGAVKSLAEVMAERDRQNAAA